MKRGNAILYVMQWIMKTLPISLLKTIIFPVMDTFIFPVMDGKEWGNHFSFSFEIWKLGLCINFEESISLTFTTIARRLDRELFRGEHQPDIMKLKMHYRKVRRLDDGYLSIKIPCGTNARITKATTKDKNKVTCKRCLKFLEAKEDHGCI